jgi:predicted dehydrogenase
MGAFTSESVRRFAPPCWFPLSHCEAIKRHPRLVLAALCDSDPLALERARNAYAPGAVFTDARALIDVVRPELLAIATRTPGRAALLLHAAEAGTRAFHAEKPLCSSMTELRQLESLFVRDDVFLTYGAIRRFFGVYRAAVELATSGQIGRLQEIRVNMGRGTLFWTHPHSVDLILFAAGNRRVGAVQARLANVVSAGGVTRIVSDPLIESATIHFTDGTIGHITRAPGADLVIAGTDGQVTVENDGRSLSIMLAEGDDPYPVHRLLPAPVHEAGTGGTYAPLVQLVESLGADGAARRANAELKAQVLLGQLLLFGCVQSHLERSRMVETQEIDAELSVMGKTGERFA